MAPKLLDAVAWLQDASCKLLDAVASLQDAPCKQSGAWLAHLTSPGTVARRPDG
jgi:hypothetical protein